MTTKVRLENRSAHMKYIGIAGGQSVAVPPQEQGGSGVEVTLDSPAEAEALKRALETPTIKGWIESGELVVHGSISVNESTPRTPTAQPAQEPGKARVGDDQDTPPDAVTPKHRR